MAMRMTESLLRLIIREELEELEEIASTGMYETDPEGPNGWDNAGDPPFGHAPHGREEENEETFRDRRT